MDAFVVIIDVDVDVDVPCCGARIAFRWHSNA